MDESDEIYAKEFLAEEDVVLSDIWDENGKYRRKALKPDGGFLPFEYLYDFGVSLFFSLSRGLTLKVGLYRTTGCTPSLSKEKSSPGQHVLSFQKLSVRSIFLFLNPYASKKQGY